MTQASLDCSQKGGHCRGVSSFTCKVSQERNTQDWEDIFSLSNRCFLVHLLSFASSQELSWLMSDIGPYWTIAITYMFSCTLTTDTWTHVLKHTGIIFLIHPPHPPGTLCKSTQQSKEKKINLYHYSTSFCLSPFENKRKTEQNLIQYPLRIILTWSQENKSFSNPPIQGILGQSRLRAGLCSWQRHLVVKLNYDSWSCVVKMV